ncbi:MAG: hypothetical protein H6668_21305 [Ardenticatenaceae bacterium]|nr:hypothetical protein [Ardenticatenaceae bacterium]
MYTRSIILLLLVSCVLFAKANGDSLATFGTESGNSTLIDFESIPGETPFEGLVISDQFLASDGIVFSLENGESPVLAQVGPPATAFAGPPNNSGDTPAPGQNIGSFFLTDDGALAGLNPEALIVSYTPPTAMASGVILDIDLGETFTIDARDANGNVLETITIIAGDPNTGDGIATRWALYRAEEDIYSIRFKGRRSTAGAFGLGFDNFNARSATFSLYLPILVKDRSSISPPLPTATSSTATPTSTATPLPPTFTPTPPATPTSTATPPPTPSNDDFNTPLSINSMPYTYVQDVSNATTANDDPFLSCYAGQGNRSVWYRYTPTSSGELSVDTFGSNYDTVLAIWTGTRGNLTEVDCNDDADGLQSVLTVSVQAGTPYFIEITSYDNVAGTLRISADFTNDPVITDLRLRYDTSSGLVVIYQDVFFYDPNGDATIVDWELISVVGGNPNDFIITDGTISIPPAQQQAGAMVTGTFTCPADFTGRLNMDVTLEDAAAQRSNTVSYSMNCSNPYP